MFHDPKRYRRKLKTSYTKISKFTNAQIKEENSFCCVGGILPSLPKAKGTIDCDHENCTPGSSTERRML
jgi:hypothetical protein